MSERTGATDAVDYMAELIARRIMHPSSVYMNGAFRDDAEKYKCVRYAREILSDITSEGMVIARAADVLTAEQRSAIGRILEYAIDPLLENCDPYGVAPEGQWRRDVDTLTAIAEGGTE